MHDTRLLIFSFVLEVCINFVIVAATFKTKVEKIEADHRNADFEDETENK